MNAQQRKNWDKIRSKLIELQGRLNDCHSELSTTAEEEQEKFDNMNEGLQASDNGQKTETTAGALTEAASALENLASEIDNVVESIEEAINA